MNPLASAVLITWQRNNSYATRLIHDIAPEMFVAQPAPGRILNHPAWVLSHLNLYAGLAVKLARAEPFEDPADHRFGQKSEPSPDLRTYDAKEQLAADWESLHAAGAAALTGASALLTDSPNPLPRWRTIHPTVGDMLVALMVKHESAHLGQLSAWRRAMGLARVPM